MLGRPGHRPGQGRTLRRVPRWGRLLCLGLLLTLVGIGLSGALLAVNQTARTVSGPVAVVSHPYTEPAVAATETGPQPAAQEDRATLQSQHLRTLPPVPTSCLWVSCPTAAGGAGNRGLVPSEATPHDELPCDTSGCRGPPPGEPV